MTRFLWDTSVPLRGLAGGGAAATLGLPNGGVRARDSRTAVVGVVGGPATGVLGDCAFGTICRA